MKANPDKYHLLVATNALASVNVNVFQKNSTEEKLPAIKFDSKLSFENLVSNICKKTSQNPHALTKILFYMSLSKEKALTKAFALFQFNYCPLVWIYHSRKLYWCINSIHERESLELDIMIINPHFLSYYKKITL